MAYYQLVSGDDYDILYVGGTTWDGASSSKPTLTKETHVLGKNDITSGSSLIGSSSPSTSFKTYITEIDLSNSLLKCTTLQYAFANLTALTSVKLPKTLPECTDMSYCFQSCTALATIDLPPLPICLNMYACFSHCTSLEEFTCSDIPAVTDLIYMFNDCSKLTSFKHGVIGSSVINTEYTKGSARCDASHMFDSCLSLQSIDLENMYIMNASYMFSECSLLNTVKNLSSIYLTTAKYMFQECIMLSNLECYLPNLYYSGYMFYNSGLTTLTGYCCGYECDYMFAGCSKLTTLNMAPREEIKVNNTMFTGCIKLVGGNGTEYNANTVGSSMCKVDDDNNVGYLTYTKNKDLYTITYKLLTAFNISSSDNKTMYGAVLYDLLTANRRVAQGSSLKLEFTSKMATSGGYVVVGADNTVNYASADASIPVEQNLTIYPVVSLGASGSLNALITAISNPH